MATLLQRSQAVCDAIINGTATADQMNRLARAISGLPQAEYDALPAAEKAALIPQAVRGWALETIRRYDRARAVANVQDTASSEFPEA